jgi:hypothetical protein
MQQHNFQRFKIIDTEDMKHLGHVEEEIYLNMNHIVSFKPINILVENDLKKGIWLRTSNGKKYRAIEFPQWMTDLLNENNQKTKSSQKIPNTDTQKIHTHKNKTHFKNPVEI